MQITLTCKPYRRAFAQPLKTSHGLWTVREGWLLRMQAVNHAVGFGEVAPIPWFNPQESIAALEQAMTAFPTTLEYQLKKPPLSPFPSLNFALETAYHQLTNWQHLTRSNQHSLRTARLLPNLSPAGEQLQQLRNLGYTTFKVKIGVQPIELEQAHCTALLNQLSKQETLRLDANGGLNLDETEAWLQVLAPFNNVEFLEQPLPPGHEAELHCLTTTYRTPIALDESIVTLHDIEANLRYFPRGPFIIKPAIFGSPSQWLAWRDSHPEPTIIYSSALETAIGYEAGLRVACADPHAHHPLGFGTTACFGQDAFQLHSERALLAPSADMSADRFEALWHTI